MVWTKNEGNNRLTWRTEETSHTFEITVFVRWHWWFSKKLTTCSVLGANWRRHPLDLKGCRRLSCAWNHSICSAAMLIFKEVYSFMIVMFLAQMKTTSIETGRLQKSLMHMKITVFVQRNWWFSNKLTVSCGVAKWSQHPLELKGCRNLSCAWNHSICSVAWFIFKEVYSFMIVVF